jgi:hypothetical protein
MRLKVQELEDKSKEAEAASVNDKNTLAAKSLQISENEQLITKLNEEIKGLKNGSKVGELVFCILLIVRLEQLKKLRN